MADFWTEYDAGTTESSFWDEYDRQKPKEEGGFVASVKSGVGAAIKGAGQAAADFIPGVDQDNALKRYGQEVIDANPTAVRSLEDIADKPWTAAKEAAGNAGGSVAQILGARAVGQGVTALAPLTGPAAPVTAAIGQAIAWFGPAAIAALPSYGGIRDKQILNDPENNESWKAKAVATLGAAAVGAIETKFGPQEWALSALTKEGRTALAEKFAATTLAGSVGKAALKGAAIEGAEELVQNPIEQVASGDDPTTAESLKDTAFGGAMGAIGGGLIGGGFGIAGRTQAKTDPIPEILDAPDVDSAIQAATEVLALPAPSTNTGETILATERGTAGTANQFDALRRPTDIREAGGGMGRNADITDVEPKPTAIQNDPAALFDRPAGDPLAPMLEDRRIRTDAIDAAQQEAEQRKSAELDAIPELASEQNAVQAALERAGTLETTTAMQLALERAKATSTPAIEPVTPVAEPAAPELPRVVERTEGMVALPQKLAEQRAAANPELEVVRFPNIDRTTGKPNGKFAFTVIPKAADVSQSVDDARSVPAGVDGRSGDVAGSEPTGRLGDSGLRPAAESGRSGAADVAVGRGSGTEPVATWFGRRGDGYLTEGDASMAIPSRQRMEPNLSWRVERMPTGKFRLAGYPSAAVQSQDASAQTQAPQASPPDAEPALPEGNGGWSSNGEPANRAGTQSVEQPASVATAVAHDSVPANPAAVTPTPSTEGVAVSASSLSDSTEKWSAKTAEYAKSIAPSAEPVGQVADYALVRDTRPDWNQDDDGRILAVDKAGNVVADVFFGRRDDGKLEAAAEVAPAARRQGIASAIYNQIERSRGESLAPAEKQTADARAFWETRQRKAAAPESATSGTADEQDRNGLRAEDRRLRTLSSAAGELAMQVENESAAADFDPKEIPAAIEQWAKDANVPADDLRAEFKKQIEGRKFRRKAGVLAAIDPTRQAVATERERIEATRRKPAPEVSRYIGKYGKGMGRDAARLEAARLNRQNDGVTYTAEEHGDPKLENPYAVVGRKAAKDQTPLFTRGTTEPMASRKEVVGNNEGGRSADDANLGATQSFDEWFKGSKIVDDVGEPLIVYHGTPHKFDAFKPDRAGGIYFAFERDIAEDYKRGGNVIEAYVSAKSVLKLGRDPYDFDKLLNALRTDPDAQERAEAISRKNEDGVQSGVFTALHDKLVIEGLKYAGFDAVIFADDHGPDQKPMVLAVFDPAQIRRADQNESPAPDSDGAKFSKGEASPFGLTPSEFTAAIAEAFGPKVAERLESNGVVIPLKDQSSLPDHVVPFVRDGDIVYGFYDPKTDKTYAVLENLSPEMVKGMVLHEVGVHYGFAQMLGREKYANVINRVKVMGKAGNKQVVAARDQAQKNAAAPSQVPEETLAYLVQNNPEMGLVREVIAAIKAFLFKTFGIGGKYLTVDDITALAKAAVLHSSRTEPGARAPDFASAPEFSRATVAGQTSRTYTAEQKRAMRNVGFEVDTPTLKERAEALWKDAGKKLAQGLYDQFAPIQELDKSAYGLLRLAKGASGAFETFLHGGKLKLTDGVYDFDDQNRGGVIEKLLIPLQGEHHDFMRWIAANRAERLLSEEREHLFSAQDIADLKTLANGTTSFDYTIQTGPQAGTVTRDRTKVYADSQRILNEFNKNALDMAEQSGLIDPESRKVWEREFYVPFYRVAEDEMGGVRGMNVKSGVVRQQAFKHLKGGKEKLNTDLLDNTLMNWAHLLDAAAKNRAAKATLEAADRMGLALEASEADARQIGNATGNKNGVVWFMDHGVKRFFVVNEPQVLTAISGLEFAGMRGPMMAALGSFKHVLTVGVTASPFFKVRNLIRDSVQVIATSPIGANPIANVAKGWSLTKGGSDAYFRLMAGGGTIHFGTMLEGSEGKRVQALVESGVPDATILNSDSKLKAFYRQYIEPGITAYNELGNRGEAINRASLYDQLIQQGVSHAEASLQARDLMDFSMQGSFTTIRFLAQTVPFLNARIVGLAKLGRGAKQNPARFAAVLGSTALLSLGLLAAYSDDDDWKKRELWDRQNFWWFKFGGTAFRIPKPFEIGAIATLAEHGAELLFDDEMTGKRFRKALLQLLGDNLSMNPIPQMVKPMLDVYSNRDSYSGRPIETMGMERLKSEYRFNDRTSMAARAASTGMNAVTGLVGAEAPSPVQIDHMVRGYFGWLGSFVVAIGDIMARPAMGQAKHPTPDYWKVATGGMIADTSSASSRYVSQMYEQAKEIEQAYGTWRALQKEGKTAEAKEFFEDNKADLVKHKKLQGIKRAEAKYNERIRIIERSNMQPDQKRDLINAIRVQQDKIARLAN